MGFGADTDIFAFADTNVELQGSTQSPSRSEAQAVDSDGDIAASTMYDSVTEYVARYKSVSDTALVFYDTTAGVDVRLGKVINSIVITSIEVSTSNTERPDVTISGRNAGSVTDSNVRKFDPSDLAIAGTRKATPIGASADTGSKVTGARGSASAEIAAVLDSVGVLADIDVHGGRVEASVDLVGVTADPAASADTGWTMSAGPSEEKGNTEYGTGSITVFKNLAGA